ncbi:hypothetical protein HW555_014291 [Spodoptera exigua]|uniref:Carbohydrate kinase PfkB domain-containing protein n=1 Tax=Spodoptera exigua TaxID=7107 RepID=A0A835KXT9_SPOEX|nr:hypothetical protein HW555_014291 [Spodoptera exigua]
MNRCNTPVKAVGGKGINAGRTAAILGSEVTAIGVLAGMNGQLIRSALEKEPFSTSFISIDGESRNAVTIMDQAKNQTEIVELGPKITAATAQKVLDSIITHVLKQDTTPIIALCGSANTQNDALYEYYLQQLHQSLHSQIKILADISGKQLQHVLTSSIKPYFIKPNIHEFSDLLATTVTNKNEIIPLLNHPLLEGISFILVSCGKEGAVAKFCGRMFNISIPSIDSINPTGSGDATVGGVAFALEQELPIEEVLKYGMACGMSNALETAVGYVSKQRVEQLKEEISVTEISLP